MAGFAENILATDTLRNVNFTYFSGSKDAGEGALLLSALLCSPSLPSITKFSCGYNNSWFSEGKENNVELLCQAIRSMKSLEYLNLNWTRL